jgi:hypothetical protein
MLANATKHLLVHKNSLVIAIKAPPVLPSDVIVNLLYS